jgi:superfamily II DNA or RNA helicase
VGLRPYQQECLDTILSRRAAGIRRQLVSMATGTGKSLLFGALPQHMPAGKRTLMIVHTKELVMQGAEHLKRWNPGLRVGIEMAADSSKGEQIVVASVQTIGRSLTQRIGKFRPEDFEWVIVDEAHRSISQTYQNVFDHFGMFEDPTGPALIGLTATPSRGDGLAMGTVYQEIVYTYNILDAVSDGWLSDICGIKLRTGADLTKVSTKAGDFDQEELSNAVNTPERNAAIVKAWIDYAWPRKTIIFCVDIAHAQEIVKGFNSSGIPAAAIWGTDKERAEKLRKHKNGELTVLACSQLLVEGYDDPEIECLDSHTEVLTESGWKGIHDEFNNVVSLNRDTGRLETVPVEARTQHLYQGEFVSTRSGRYDFRVTANHQMLVGLGRAVNPMSFVPAKELLNVGRFRLPVSASPLEREGIPVTDDELRFIAWFTTDGSRAGRTKQQIRISQSKTPEHIERIRLLLDRLGWNYGHSVRDNKRGYGKTNGKPLHNFFVPKGVRNGVKGWNHLAEYLDKNISDSLMKMSSRQFSIFWEELLWGNGNGDKRANRQQCLCIVNDKQNDRLQALAALSGYHSNSVVNCVLPSGLVSRTMSVSQKRFIEIKTQTFESKKRTLVSDDSSETVWCVQNKNRTLIIRRFGSVSIVGNCVIMGRPTKSQTFFIQACGRGTRLGTGIGNLKQWREEERLIDNDKQNCLLIDCADVTGRHSLVSLPSLFGLSPNLDLEGQSITAAVRAINSALAAHPQADVSGLEKLSDLETHVQSVDLWQVRFAEEVRGFSELQWVKRGDGSYRILLPDNGYFKIDTDIVGKCRIQGSLKGQAYRYDKLASLADAVKLVEQTITTITPEHLILLSRESKWLKAPVTGPQMKMLERLKVPAEQIVKMTRGSAAAFITSRFNKQS